MEEIKTATNPPLVVTPASPYDFGELMQETIQIVTRQGNVIVNITCHEATGKEMALLSRITREENDKVDEYFRQKGGVLGEPDVKGLRYWKFPPEVRFTPEEDVFISFQRRVYPKLAACSTCDLERLPTAEEAWRFPEAQYRKWLAAAVNVNPSWFDEFKQTPRQQIIEEMKSGDGVKRHKKKSKKR